MTFEYPYWKNGQILDLIRYPDELEEQCLNDIHEILQYAGFHESFFGCGNDTINYGKQPAQQRPTDVKTRALIRTADNLLVEMGISPKGSYDISILCHALDMNEKERNRLAEQVIDYRTNWSHVFAEGSQFAAVIHLILSGRMGELHLRQNTIRAQFRLLIDKSAVIPKAPFHRTVGM